MPSESHSHSLKSSYSLLCSFFFLRVCATKWVLILLCFFLVLCASSPDVPPPPPSSTHMIHAALFRATQPSLGSVVLASLILAVVRMIALACTALRALPAYLPPYMRFASVAAGMLVGYLERVTDQLSTYALVYIGLTGDPCMPSARRARALTGAVETESYRKKFKTERKCKKFTMIIYSPASFSLFDCAVY